MCARYINMMWQSIYMMLCCHGECVGGGWNLDPVPSVFAACFRYININICILNYGKHLMDSIQWMNSDDNFLKWCMATTVLYPQLSISIFIGVCVECVASVYSWYIIAHNNHIYMLLLSHTHTNTHKYSSYMSDLSMVESLFAYCSCVWDWIYSNQCI